MLRIEYPAMYGQNIEEIRQTANEIVAKVGFTFTPVPDDNSHNVVVLALEPLEDPGSNYGQLVVSGEPPKEVALVLFNGFFTAVSAPQIENLSRDFGITFGESKNLVDQL